MEQQHPVDLEHPPEPDIPEAAAEADADAEARAAEAQAAEAAPARPRRRVARTAALIAAAAVLGVVAGTVTGYAVQIDREPTPLPPLAQQTLATPKPAAAEDSTTAGTINANRGRIGSDDLKAALLPAPADAGDKWSGWESVDMYASDVFADPAHMVGELTEGGLRRIATSTWSGGDKAVEVRLLQFSDREGAEDFRREQSGYMSDDTYAGNEGVELPGIPGEIGRVWVYESGGEARAVVRRGDVVLDLSSYVRDGKPSRTTVIDLARRQLERL
ncbi:hypothetical protein [Streptomyces sp. NPDC048603]|uniref:hypothetical protein n=1 Tax=Streptomyces sp. NPDC048603 TaxID=3365577 RepID=UPI00371E61A3